MPRRETILSVFVASPSDLDDERGILEEVIRELNTSWSRSLAVRLELVSWETHAYPGFAEDPQAVINEQIPDDYDLFIGLMWYRFGTPTGRAESGTIEEFQRAKARYDSNPNDLKLMIYFKESPAPIPPTKLDYAQIAKISEFRSTLGPEGGLYWTFQDSDDFEKLIRMHLTRQVQEWISMESSTDVDPEAIEQETPAKDDEGQDDIGFLDLMEQFEDECTTLVEIMERMAETTEEIGQKMAMRSAETEEFAKGPDSTNRSAAKRMISKAASDMDQYVYRMEAELPLFSKHLNAGMNALTQAAAISIEFNNTDDDGLEQAKENLAAVREFRETMDTVEGQIAEFQESIASIPRMTTVLNRSKRAMINIIQRLLDEFHAAQTLARESEASFKSILDNK